VDTVANEAGMRVEPPKDQPRLAMGISAADYDLDGVSILVKDLTLREDNHRGIATLATVLLMMRPFEAGLGLRPATRLGCGSSIRQTTDGRGTSDLQRQVLSGKWMEQLKTEAGYAKRKILYPTLP